MDIDVLFALLLADIDSVPFAREDYWTKSVGDLRTEDTR
jgi:hypothetical protein